MSAAWSCLQCRTAKAKCDLARPQCGRCFQQGSICSGLPLDSVFLFRDENEVAKRNSRRARGQKRQSPVAVASSSSDVTSLAQWPPQEGVSVTDGTLQQHFNWLNQRALAEVPVPIKRDVETRAIERFFVEWTFYPSNHGTTPGYMHDLPVHFYGAQPDSLLWLAVQAMAFADMRNERAGNVSFSIKAQSQYGLALNRMRAIVDEKGDLANDSVLAAMILIDNFELIYLSRNNPLGPHNGAIRHILRSRGDKQLYNPTRFSLWRLTHYRLQFWQTLFREEPDVQQRAWVSKLNMERPELRICAEVLQMNVLSAIARILTQSTEAIGAMHTEQLEKAKQLIRDILDLLVSAEKWTTEMSEVWKAEVHDSQYMLHVQDINESAPVPMPNLPYPQLLSYDDLWMAFIWNFYSASQIILRESLVDVLNYVARIEGYEVASQSNEAVIQEQLTCIERLSTTVIKSFPMLLGLTQKGHQGASQIKLSHQGRMAGRLFALFSMWVVQRARFTSAQHKQTASEVVAWINSRHGLR